MKRDVSIILLLDSNGRFLLQHRSDDAPRLPGFWAFFGGGIEKGESPEAAIKREAKEELDYDLKHPFLVFTQDYTMPDQHGRKFVFVERFDPGKKLTLLEGKDMAWLSFDEARDLKIVDHDREVLDYLESHFDFLHTE